MPGFPEEALTKYFRNMITEEERLDIGTAYYEDGFIDGMEKGKAEGMVEGEARARRELAKSMLAEGLDPAFVSKHTQLSQEEVLVLQKSM